MKKEKERSNSGDSVTQTSSPGGWQAKLSALNFFHLQVSRRGTQCSSRASSRKSSRASDASDLTMAKAKSIYTNRNAYTDRAKEENDAYNVLDVKIQTLDTTLLLLDSEEEMVLITVFKHLTDHMRKQPENIADLKEKNMLDLLLNKEFYISNESVIVKRFALYIVTALIENMNTLQDLLHDKTMYIMELCLRFYLIESDNFCTEYLSVIMNKCLDDPQVAVAVEQQAMFFEKFLPTVSTTPNPDTLLHSLEILRKILEVQSMEAMLQFAAGPLFPTDRLICDVTDEFTEIRSAALKVLKLLITDCSEESPVNETERATRMLQQLVTVFCNVKMNENLEEVIEVLAIAMRCEAITQLFFEQNLFDKVVHDMEVKVDRYTPEIKCKVIAIFAETAKYQQFLYRLHIANITELFLHCLMTNDPPATHILTGLNRIMKFTEAASQIVAAYAEGLLAKLLKIMVHTDYSIKTREQTAVFVGHLLVFAFHPTATGLIALKFPDILGEIFAQKMFDLSIDYILTLLNIIESLSQNNDYRRSLAVSFSMTRNLALLLKDSFMTSVLVNNIFICLGTLVDEDEVRALLLANYIAPSLKRALQSLSNVVKISATNFIMMTTRYPEFAHEYIEAGVLEVLIMFQKHAFCVSTWSTAIESILSKCPTLKFCIRNHLSFTDSTVGMDFVVSKKKFDDFRIFQTILKEEVSPLHPILVVNFLRPKNLSEENVYVPLECFSEMDIIEGEEVKNGWCYCRKPGDQNLPIYLNNLNEELERQGVVENPAKVKRCIDFDNVAKRAKIIAEIVARCLGHNLKSLDLNATEECSYHIVNCHMRDLRCDLHCNFIPLGMLRSGCQFERAILFKALADQIGLPCTLQRSVDGRFLFNEVPLPVENDLDIHCDPKSMKFLPWRLLRPTHIVDLMYNVGELYPMQSRQALQYLRLY